MSSEAEPLLLGRRVTLGRYRWLPAVTSVGLLAVVSLSGYIFVDSLSGVDSLQAGAPGYGKHAPNTKDDWIKRATEAGKRRIHILSRLIAGLDDADEDAGEKDASEANDNPGPGPPPLPEPLPLPRPSGVGYDFDNEPPVDEVYKQGERARLIEMDAATRMPYRLESRAAEVQQVQSMLGGKPQLCSSCAVVIPSDVLRGNKMGQLIDSHECVVRFNAHAPTEEFAEDWGTKDDIRVLNPMRVDDFYTQGQGQCINPPENHTCRRVYFTWETGGAISFINSNPYGALLPNVVAEFWPGEADVHDELRGWANGAGFGIPMYASSAHFAIHTLRHPELCGVMTIFGVPDDGGQDSIGYLDPHGGISPAHDYNVEHEFWRTVTGVRGETWRTWHHVHIEPMRPVSQTK